jgi:hypothetical protein
MAIKPIAYKGRLNVNPHEFDLELERICKNDTKIIFHFIGRDADGPFSLEGYATLGNIGLYLSPPLLVKYDRFKGTFYAQIQITSYVQRPNSCVITGMWMQEGDEWEFRGNLKVFR